MNELLPASSENRVFERPPPRPRSRSDALLADPQRFQTAVHTRAQPRPRAPRSAPASERPRPASVAESAPSSAEASRPTSAATARRPRAPPPSPAASSRSALPPSCKPARPPPLSPSDPPWFTSTADSPHQPLGRLPGVADGSHRDYGTDLARRKPRLLLRKPGASLLRSAARRSMPREFHAPPRFTRFAPVPAHCGSVPPAAPTLS